MLVQFSIIKLFELELVWMIERQNEIEIGIQFQKFQHTSVLAVPIKFDLWNTDHYQRLEL